MSSCQFKIGFILHEPPISIYDGCCWKYMFDTKTYTQDILLYCDIDIYICSSLGKLFKDTNKNTIYVHPEGDLNDSSYGAHCSEENLQLFSNMPGLSAGKFAIQGKELADSFFSSMKHTITNHISEKKYYTLEQPLFNYTVYSYIDSSSIEFDLFFFTTSVNLYKYTKDTTVFLDCMGEPGNGTCHLEKFINLICLFHSKLL
jgi:hypothetical protein